MVQAYSLYSEDLRMLLATFLSEFHGVTLWHGDSPDLILMAPAPGGRILSRPGTRCQSPLHEDFKELGMTIPRAVWFYMLDARPATFASGARINTTT